MQVALSRLSGGYYTDQALVMAGTLLGTLPLVVVFIVFGRQIIGGIMEGGVKGMTMDLSRSDFPRGLPLGCGHLRVPDRGRRPPRAAAAPSIWDTFCRDARAGGRRRHRRRRRRPLPPLRATTST